MPIYEFKCPRCRLTFDKLVKMGQKTTNCTICAGAFNGPARARRVLSATPGVVKNPAVPRRSK